MTDAKHVLTTEDRKALYKEIRHTTFLLRNSPSQDVASLSEQIADLIDTLLDLIEGES